MDLTVIMICKPNKDTDIVDSLQITIIQLENQSPHYSTLTFTTTLKAFSTCFPLQLHGTLTFYLRLSRFLLRSSSIRKWPFYKLFFKLLLWFVYLQKLTEPRARKGRVWDVAIQLNSYSLATCYVYKPGCSYGLHGK